MGEFIVLLSLSGALKEDGKDMRRLALVKYLGMALGGAGCAVVLLLLLLVVVVGVMVVVVVVVGEGMAMLGEMRAGLSLGVLGGLFEYDSCECC